MKPFCFLLFATTVLQTTEGQSQGQGQSQSQSETQSQGLSLSQSLTCGPTNRGGKSLGSPRWKPQLPSSCRQASSASSAALCDEPGADYPWEAIDNYLRRSSSQAKKRALASRSRPASGAKTPPRGSASAPNSPRGNGAAEESTLRADSGTAPSTPRVTSDLADGAAAPGFPPGDSSGGVSNSLRRRRGRSAVAVATENVREKKDIGPPPGNWEASGDGLDDLVDEEVLATDTTSIGDMTDLTLIDESVEGSGVGLSEGVSKSPEINASEEEDMAILVSFFTDHSSEIVTKEALKDILEFRKAFEKVDSITEATPTPTAGSEGPTTSRNGLIVGPTTLKPSTLTTKSPSDTETNTQNLPSEVSYYQPTRQSTHDPTTPTFTDAPTADSDSLASTRPIKRSPAPVLPPAERLVARPPSIVEFNRRTSTFPARQRVTTRRTPPPRPTTWEPELDGFTELVYVTDTYRQHGEANVTKVTAWETVRQTTSFPPRPSMPTPTTTPTPTPDPYTESACSYREEVRSPFFARNTRYEWKTLINMPNYETFIHMEHCVEEQSQGRCAAGCRCTQKYTVRTMPVYDRDSNGCDTIYMDKFLFPSHCDCKCLPVTHLFHAGRRPTSALPSVERPPKPSFARPPPGEFGREHEWVRERERERGKERERNQEMEMEMEMEREREREMERERQREREKGRERQQERERGRGREKERADPPDGYRPSPAVARPRAPSRRRPAVIVPPEAEKPVPPRVPIVPSDAPVLNHRNWQRGPQDTPPDHRQRRAVSR
ncbi:uncharacterized protein LOC119104863 isoform X1 [Pollicipes pollicipes]|uniref:uncharacterized protein LOC119104863 isoform X1 n=1 Tax=Pollicipes pollicipes TaxID=41117 RepID=UPI00188519A6|nr:uncharacterized protein LOC119104863 isoform X1 [Pollicipes pollicipes]